MSKATTTLPCVCAVCGREIEGLPYHAAGIVKKGEYYLSIVTCSREHQRAYNARHNGAAQQNQGEAKQNADAD